MTEEQRKHYEKLLKLCGEPPKRATHFDMNDLSLNSWKLDSDGYYYMWNNDDHKWKWSGGVSPYWSLVPIPKGNSKHDNQKEPSGSANSYYWIEIPLDRVKIDQDKGVVGFMLEQYIKYGLGNDFDRGNLCKANHRIGRKGNSKEYEISKMHYYVGQIDKNFEEEV